MEKKESQCSCGRLLPTDRISSLPDDILFFILSFLKFKEMAKTSILSSRWLKLWVNTPILDFRAPVSNAIEIADGERQNFVEWVNHVLQRHKGHHLKKFKIIYGLDNHNQEDINRWLEFALARKVESLELNFSRRRGELHSTVSNYAFPDWFLKFTSGEANLDGGEGHFLQFDLKCLKSLYLVNVDVSGEAINLILQNCSLLERLVVVGSLKLVDLVISNPTLVLKYLLIKSCCNLKVLNISNFNLVSLDIPSVGDLTLTNLPMLVELSIGQLTLTNLSMLVELPIAGTSDKLSHSLTRASFVQSQLEAFSLHAFKLEDLTRLSNLTRLTKLKRLVITIGALVDESLLMLVSILKSCPQLMEFVFMLIWNNPDRIERSLYQFKELSSSSTLISESFKIFEFKGYYGRASDLELLAHVVDNAPGLEKIIIEPRDVFLMIPREFRTVEEELARIIALENVEDLKESEYIPPNVDVLVR